jgi:hypothetical protein
LSHRATTLALLQKSSEQPLSAWATRGHGCTLLIQAPCASSHAWHTGHAHTHFDRARTCAALYVHRQPSPLPKMPSADDLKTPTRTPSRTPSGSPKPPRASSGGGGPSRQGSGAGSDGTPSRQGSGAGPARTVSGGGGGDVAEVDPLCIVVLSNNLSSEDLTVVSRARSHHQHTPATVLENLRDAGQHAAQVKVVFGVFVLLCNQIGLLTLYVAGGGHRAVI